MKHKYKNSLGWEWYWFNGMYIMMFRDKGGSCLPDFAEVKTYRSAEDKKVFEGLKERGVLEKITLAEFEEAFSNAIQIAQNCFESEKEKRNTINEAMRKINNLP